MIESNQNYRYVDNSYSNWMLWIILINIWFYGLETIFTRHDVQKVKAKTEAIDNISVRLTSIENKLDIKLNNEKDKWMMLDRIVNSNMVQVRLNKNDR